MAMPWRKMLLAAGSFLLVTAVLEARSTLYKIELLGKETIWAEDRPQETGKLLLFHGYPGGVLMSIRKGDVRRVVELPHEAPPKVLRPGEALELGSPAYGGRSAQSAGATATAGRTRSRSAAPRPASTTPQLGERKDGTALLDSDRQYRPEWDTKQVPGLNLAYPASPDDYREGKTLAYPPASGVQSAPGEPPMMPAGNGDVPRGPK